jgi:hypothetical protein
MTWRDRGERRSEISTHFVQDYVSVNSHRSLISVTAGSREEEGEEETGKEEEERGEGKGGRGGGC